MVRCDSEGVPRLIQQLRVVGGSQLYEVYLFNGHSLKLPFEYFPTPHRDGLHSDNLEPVRWIYRYELYQDIEAFCLKHCFYGED